MTGVLSVSCSFIFSLSGDLPDTAGPPPNAEEPSPDTEEPSPAETGEAAEPCHPVTAKSIALIQFEETGSTEKIALIDQFAELKDEELQNCLMTVTDKELIGLTFFDLSRHTNPALAQKAKDLTERFHPAEFVEEGINSGDEELQGKVVEFLLRIGPERAEEILNEVSFEAEEDGERLKEEVSGKTHRILVPTNSIAGDRYYVRAKWDPENEEQVNCLTDLFNKELAAGRSLDAEKAKMKALNGLRWVYWYSKDWAVSIAEAVEKCSATAVFVEGPATSPVPLSQPDSHTGSDEDPTSKAPPANSSADSALQLYDSNKNGKISCKEARKHGIAPVKREHPAYKYMNDRNNDGVVCEKIRSSSKSGKTGKRRDN